MVNRNLLKAAIARAGMTQEKLAERIGISANTLSKRMLGSSPFNTDEIDMICEVLNIHGSEEKAIIFLADSSQNWDY